MPDNCVPSTGNQEQFMNLMKLLGSDRSLSSGNVELDRHQREHAVEKRFQCQTCKRRFSTLEFRDRHLLTHTGRGLFDVQSVVIFCVCTTI